MACACVEKKEGTEVQGSRPTGRPKRTWTEVVQKIVKQVNLTRKMLWIVVDGRS